jgi:hypothetical protein
MASKKKTPSKKPTTTSSKRASASRSGGAPKAAKASKPVVTKRAAGGTPATTIATNALTIVAPLSTAGYGAILNQTTKEERADLGGRTKGDGVLRDVGDWITLIMYARSKFAPSVLRYGDTRVAYLCMTALALGDVIAEARGARGGATSAGGARVAAFAAARSVRDDVLHALEQVTKGSADASALADVERDLAHDDQLAIALGKLADLADAWVTKAGKDEGVAALVSGAGLTSDDAAAARNAAAALVGASVDAKGAGSRAAQDPPDVNAAEGAVIAEMRIARRAFEQAKKKDPRVPALNPGAATRAVIGTHVRKPAAKPAPVPPPPAPGPSPANGGDAAS